MAKALAVAALVLALCLPGGAAAATRAGSAAGFPRTEAAVRTCANAARRAQGLRPLLPDLVLDRAARLQARNMARFGFFDHQDPWGRGPVERVRLYDPGRTIGFPIGENIAMGYPTASAACRGWLGSPGHRANILGRGYTRIGAGVWRSARGARFYVQVFGVRR
jgi:uncharacterized protein YkwD